MHNVNITGKNVFPTAQFAIAMRDGRIQYNVSDMTKSYALEQLNSALNAIETANTTLEERDTRTKPQIDWAFNVLQGAMLWDKGKHRWVPEPNALLAHVQYKVLDGNDSEIVGLTREFDNSLYDTTVTKTKGPGYTAGTGVNIYAAKPKDGVNPFKLMQNEISANQYLLRYGVKIDANGETQSSVDFVQKRLNKFGTQISGRL